MHKVIGTMEILQLRIYPLDAAAKDPETTVCVEPGIYGVFQDGDVVYFMLSGRINERGFHKLGDGLFMLNHGDAPGDVLVSFPTKRLGPKEWADFQADPQCQEGPEQRLRFTLVASTDA